MQAALVVLGLCVCAGALHGQCALPPQPYFEFQVEVPARFVPDTLASPRPKAEPGVSPGQLAALVQFVVDTAGVADPRSYRVLSAQDPELAAKGREALRHWRFRPARLGSCPVPQVVQTPLVR